MTRALFKFDRNIPQQNVIVIDTTSNTSAEWKYLSPFILPAPLARNLENLWQFSKVYKQHIGADGLPTSEWWEWRVKGFNDPKAHRYPMGKGAVPECSWWDGWRLDYVSARKEIYIPHYSYNVVKTGSFASLRRAYQYSLLTKSELILLDYNAYDHQALGITLKDVVNNPFKKCGHAFVLLSLLTGEPLI